MTQKILEEEIDKEIEMTTSIISHKIIEEEKLKILEEYIDEKFEESNNLNKIKYLLFKLKLKPKNKYNLIKDLVALVLEEEEEIFQRDFDFKFNLPFLEELISASKIHNEKKDEINKIIKRLYNEKEEFLEIPYINEFLKFNKEDLEGQLDVLRRAKDKHTKENTVRILEKALNLGNALDKSVKTYIHNKLIELTLELANNDNAHPIFKIKFLESTFKYLKLEKNEEKEKEALCLLQTSIEKASEGMESRAIPLPSELVAIDEEIKKALEEEFDKEKEIDKKILKLTKNLGNPPYHKPYPSIDILKKNLGDRKEDVLSMMTKTISIDKDRRLPDKDSNIDSQMKSFYYNFHGRNIRIMLEKLKQDDNFTEEKLKELLASKVAKSDKGFIEEILDSYFRGKNFSLIASTASYIEKLLREIYKAIHGNDVDVMNKAPEAQIKIKLTNVLTDPLIKGILSEDFIEYSKWLLNSDEEGHNVRNNVGHGFEEYDYYSKELADLVLYYLINLIEIRSNY